MTTDKQAAYRNLVERRKACMACQGLTNPSVYCGGRYDSNEIGPWSLWQANLRATVMIVGQDWGDVAAFERQEGRDLPNSATNATLIDLLHGIGVETAGPEAGRGPDGTVFLTNAVLCLKKGGCQAAVLDEWFANCGQRFLRPLIELVQPKVVICLGERAYHAVEKLYELPRRQFRDAVSAAEGFPLSEGMRLFAVYHCGRRIQNTHRNLEQQKTDWKRVASWLDRIKD